MHWRQEKRTLLFWLHRTFREYWRHQVAQLPDENLNLATVVTVQEYYAAVIFSAVAIRRLYLCSFQIFRTSTCDVEVQLTLNKFENSRNLGWRKTLR